MQSTHNALPSLPSPTRWGLSVEIGGRPVIRGVLMVNSVSGTMVSGTVNFRGTPIPINGTWNENTKQIYFDSPYASFSGQLQIFDSAQIRVRHFVLSGRFAMKPPSAQAGEAGNWIATTDKELTGPPITTQSLPPVGAFLTSDLLYGTESRYRNMDFKAQRNAIFPLLTSGGVSILDMFYSSKRKNVSVRQGT